MLNIENEFLAYRRFCWRKQRRIALFLDFEPTSKRKTRQHIDAAVQEAIHEQLTQQNRRTFRGPVAVEVRLRPVRAGTPVHAATKWLLDLLGPRKHPISGSRRRFMAYEDDGQVSYLAVSCWPRKELDEGDPSRPLISVYIRPLRYFVRDVGVAARALLELDEDPGDRFSIDDYYQYLEDRPSIARFVGANETLEALDAIHQREVQTFLGERAQLGIRHLDALYRYADTRPAGKWRAGRQTDDKIPGLAAKLKAEIERSEAYLVRSTVDTVYTYQFSARGVRMNLEHRQQRMAGASFAAAVETLFDDYVRRLGKLLNPYLLPPAIEVVYLRGPGTRSATPDLDNALRTVLGIFQKKVGTGLLGATAESQSPLTCEVLSIPGWEQTGMNGVTSIGLVPGAPFHISYATEVDDLVEKWGRIIG